MRGLVLAAGMSALLGCAEALSLSRGDDEAGADAGSARSDSCFTNPEGECVVTSEGCDPASIRGSALERCASCEQGGVGYEICGPAKTARCFDLELGQPCQRCVTDDGEVLYDDCSARVDQFGDLHCEAVAYEGADADCEVCRDDHGVVVRESCRPNASRCEERVVNGRACRECFTAEGAFAYRECEPADLDPAICEVYGGAEGRCVDCYGADNELLSHECTTTPPPGLGTEPGPRPPEAPPSYCDSMTDPAGRSCTLCYNADGGLVEEQCDDGTSRSPARCEELLFREQVCLVCVDGNGQESSTQCSRAPDSCEGIAAECGPAPPCENRYRDDGTLCRTCPTANGDETLCMSGGGLTCETVQEFDETPPIGGVGDPGLTSEVCTVCRAPGMEEPVYSVCSSDGTVPPQPVCSTRETADDVMCEVCVAPGGGDEVYSSCR